MRVNQKILAVISIILNIITLILAVLCINKYVNIDIMMLFLGLAQIGNGLNQISLSKQINEDGVMKGSRIVGIAVILIGIMIIIMVSKKYLL